MMDPSLSLTRRDHQLSDPPPSDSPPIPRAPHTSPKQQQSAPHSALAAALAARHQVSAARTSEQVGLPTHTSRAANLPQASDETNTPSMPHWSTHTDTDEVSAVQYEFTVLCVTYINNTCAHTHTHTQMPPHHVARLRVCARRRRSSFFGNMLNALSGKEKSPPLKSTEQAPPSADKRSPSENEPPSENKPLSETSEKKRPAAEAKSPLDATPAAGPETPRKGAGYAIVHAPHVPSTRKKAPSPSSR